MSSDRQSAFSPVERRANKQEMYSPPGHTTPRNDCVRYPDSIPQHSYHHQHRSSSPSLYYNNYETHGDFRSGFHHYQHDSYHTESNIGYRSNSGNNHTSYNRHSGYPEHANYAMRASYDEHYDPREDDHLDSNDNHLQSGINVNGMMMTDNKHRNNSISSNASSTTSSNSNSNSASTANKHPCKFPTCGWSFKRFEHLKRHMLVHTKERPFVCEFKGCEKSFSRSDNFSAHLRTHTKKSITTRKPDRHLMMDPMNHMPGAAGEQGTMGI
ncbi:hypothetical protein BGZ65_009599, partial [Modicella reniformis]